MLVRRTRSSKRRGGVLIACLAIVMTMAAMSAMLLQLESGRARTQLFSADQKRSLNMAEAGLAEAFYALAIGKSGAVGAIDDPARFGDGLFWVEAEELENGLINLESTGMCGAGRATLGLVVHRSPVSIASFGIMGGDSVSLGGRALVDSYDSRENAAPGALAPDSVSFRVQSNGDIELGSMARVKGDATPGFEGSVILGQSAKVDGSTSPGEAAVSLPNVDIPELPAKSFTSPLLPSQVTIQAGEASYTNVTIGAASQLTITGPATLALNKLSIQDLGKLHLDTTDGPITLYVKDWLNLAPTATVTFAERDPSRVSILVAASQTKDHSGDLLPDAPVQFNYSGVFYGSMYAPSAAVSLASGFEYFGALTAKELAIGSNAKVHFDVALEGETNGESSSVQKFAWSVIDVPMTVATNLRTDPFAALGVDKHALKTPAEASDGESYQIHIQYLDLLLNQQNYRGPESGFDWGQVKVVLKILRQEL